MNEPDGAAVLRAFADVVGQPAPNGLDTNPDDVQEWDSLAHMHLVRVIETRLGQRVPNELLVLTPDITLRRIAEGR